MSRYLLFIVLFFPCFSSEAQTLFTYGKYSVSKAEFERAFQKNSALPVEQRNDPKDYLDLYINFKLKVQAAKDLQLDTLAEIKAEVHHFQQQLEEQFLKDDEALEKLINEAFLRSQKDIHLIDYFFPLPKGEDTLPYYKAANDFYRQLLRKNTPEKKLSPVNGLTPVKTDAGWITVFSLPYAYENIVYKLKPGHFSAPFRGPDGWHIFQHAGEQKAAGEIELAQILLSFPENDAVLKEKTARLADSLYILLKKGADFAHLAKEFSHDRTSSNNGGRLAAFGRGKFDREFEHKAFSIKTDGEVLPPFESAFGFHIIKRISATHVPANKEPLFINYLMGKIGRDSRMDIAKEAFKNRVRISTGLEKADFNEEVLWQITDSALLAQKTISETGLNEETPVLLFNDQSVVKVRNWTQYLRNKGIALSENAKNRYPSLFREFSDATALKNYRSRLAFFNPEFKQQMEEFIEGNLLFEIMEREIWQKSATDTLRLKEIFEASRGEYLWDESADILIFSTVSNTIANNLMKDLKNSVSLETLVEKYGDQIQIDSGRYEINQIPLQNGEKLSVNKITQPVQNTQSESVVFCKVLKLHPAGKERNFEEARGLVLSNYQDLLEKEWLSRLKQQYPVNVSPSVLQLICGQ